MGLRHAVAKLAVRRLHVLVAEVPGWWATRVALERELAQRGGRLADSPAEADVLVVCGVPGPELADAVERSWDQLPGPRARASVASPDEIGPALTAAADRLRDDPWQVQDARHRSDHEGAGDGHDDHDHGGAGSDHHGHDMAGPGGLALASGGEDRDGLEMDVLHLRLGPVLRHWPAGMTLRCDLQGDVITGAEMAVLVGDVSAMDGAAPGPARRADAVATVLALLGWDHGARSARQVRDLLVDGADPAAAVAAVERLRREVVRSRVVRWALRDVGRLVEHPSGAFPRRWQGDAYDRLLGLLPGTGPDPADPAAGEAPEELPAGLVTDLVTGLDLATARLVIASLGLEPGRLTVEAPHG